ncbi:MAG TPA: hypothetical protein DEP05_06525 [Betaproteobacteria bacterium]|nr:hypothetical protein [Betaproteobacteria bacterium]
MDAALVSHAARSSGFARLQTDSAAKRRRRCQARREKTFADKEQPIRSQRYRPAPLIALAPR